jgi:hypothetical protein
MISDTIVNTQTETGIRIEYWDSRGAPRDGEPKPPRPHFIDPVRLNIGDSEKKKIRRYTDVGRLNVGR